MQSCPQCGFTVDYGISQCRRCGADLVFTIPSMAEPALFPPAPPPPAVNWAVEPARPVVPMVPIQSLATTLSVLLGFTAAALLLWVIAPEAGFLAGILTLTDGVLMLIWLYRARSNVEGLGRQRLAKGWAIGGWFCPVVNIWFPLQIVEDVARIDNPPQRPRAGMSIRGAWWICWLLSWVTGIHYIRSQTVHPDGTYTESFFVGMYFGDTQLSRLFGAAAAILLAIIVYQISARQEVRRRVRY